MDALQLFWLLVLQCDYFWSKITSYFSVFLFSSYAIIAFFGNYFQKGFHSKTFIESTYLSSHGRVNNLNVAFFRQTLDPTLLLLERNC